MPPTITAGFIMYLLILNLIGFISMGADKRKAIRHKWRIPEKALFLIAILGGSLGSRLGMTAFRHKTKHNSFVIGIPVIILIQSAALLIYYVYFIGK